MSVYPELQKILDDTMALYTERDGFAIYREGTPEERVLWLPLMDEYSMDVSLEKVEKLSIFRRLHNRIKRAAKWWI